VNMRGPSAESRPEVSTTIPIATLGNETPISDATTHRSESDCQDSSSVYLDDDVLTEALVTATDRLGNGETQGSPLALTSRRESCMVTPQPSGGLRPSLLVGQSSPAQSCGGGRWAPHPRVLPPHTPTRRSSLGRRSTDLHRNLAIYLERNQK
jgi:hypothetical protein